MAVLRDEGANLFSLDNVQDGLSLFEAIGYHYCRVVVDCLHSRFQLEVVVVGQVGGGGGGVGERGERGSNAMVGTYYIF